MCVKFLESWDSIAFKMMYIHKSNFLLFLLSLVVCIFFYVAFVGILNDKYGLQQDVLCACLFFLLRSTFVPPVHASVHTKLGIRGPDETNTDGG